MSEEIETLARKLQSDAAISCQLLIGDSFPVWEMLKSDPGYFKRAAIREIESRHPT